jgi:hypothetical protein
MTVVLQASNAQSQGMLNVSCYVLLRRAATSDAKIMYYPKRNRTRRVGWQISGGQFSQIGWRLNRSHANGFDLRAVVFDSLELLRFSDRLWTFVR